MGDDELRAWLEGAFELLLDMSGDDRRFVPKNPETKPMFVRLGAMCVGQFSVINLEDLIRTLRHLRNDQNVNARIATKSENAGHGSKHEQLCVQLVDLLRKAPTNTSRSPAYTARATHERLGDTKPRTRASGESYPASGRWVEQYYHLHRDPQLFQLALHQTHQEANTEKPSLLVYVRIYRRLIA